jgi:glycosyltransferase involved in cell wall biosynthesis
MDNKIISIVTPTYNRGYIINKLYSSLLKQTNSNFNWIIIDDGSSDNTDKLVNEWINRENPFEIIYKKIDNGGKHRALNYAMQFVDYKYVFIVDSDDHLIPNAIELVLEWIETIDNKKNFAGVSGLRITSQGEIIGTQIKEDYIDASNYERRKYNLLGDKAEVYKADLLKQYPFPEFEGENFLPENAVWDALALAGYKLRWFNKAIYVCDYLEDGLTKSAEKRIRNNFKGYTYSVKLLLKGTPFPLDIYILGAYMIRAKKKGMGVFEIKDSLELSMLKVFLGKFTMIYHILRNSIRKTNE